MLKNKKKTAKNKQQQQLGRTWKTGRTNNTYNVDGQYIVATLFHSSAIGTVKLKDLVLETTYDPRRLGTLMTARMAVGSNILRPESAISIKTQ